VPIPAELLSVLFVPFYRSVDRARGAPRDSSLGLGLFIAREIVTAHGGTIEVGSSSEDGTTFTVRLPRQLPPDRP
jgi:signal transduction histidine kinase